MTSAAIFYRLDNTVTCCSGCCSADLQSTLSSHPPPPLFSDQSQLWPVASGAGCTDGLMVQVNPAQPQQPRRYQRLVCQLCLCWSPVSLYCAMYHCAQCAAGCHQLSLFTSLASNVQFAATLCPGTRQQDGQSYYFRDIKMIKTVKVW